MLSAAAALLKVSYFCSFLLIHVVMGEHMIKHGDGVKDIAFEVEDLDSILQVGLHLN